MKRRPMRLLPVVAALVALAVLSGCAGRAASAEPVRTSHVDLPPSYVFAPAAVAVPAGTTVTWTNNDHFSHSVQVAGGQVHAMRPGETVSVVFDRPGEYEYLCTYHPQNMKGKVVVTAG
ncbi:MAG: cupredoxin domain-containing protein [Chloroflexi bacterium]|nr:cupredoxin domain-containing protein [Chloroflexota bacterium]